MKTVRGLIKEAFEFFENHDRWHRSSDNIDRQDDEWNFVMRKVKWRHLKRHVVSNAANVEWLERELSELRQRVSELERNSNPKK